MAATTSLREKEGELFSEADMVRVLKSAAHNQGGHASGQTPAGNASKNSFDVIDERLGSLLWNFPKSVILEKFYKALPMPGGIDFLSLLYRGFVQGQIHNCNADKHIYAQIALENPLKVPIFRQFPFQNGWSAYKFTEGATTVRDVYTMVDGHGRETIIHIRLNGEGEQPAEKIERFAENLAKKEYAEINAFSQQMISEKLNHAENAEFTRAGCYGELTDRDISDIVDPKSFKRLYMENELAFIVSTGGKTISRKNGIQILKYSESAKSIRKGLYHLTGSNIYSVADVFLEPVEKLAERSKLIDNEQMMGIYNGIVNGTIKENSRLWGVKELYTGVNDYGGGH